MADCCVLCGSAQWADLIAPHPRQSVRVDGVIEPYPLRKRHCKTCGLGYRAPTDNPEPMYRERYALYANRPGAEAFQHHRHQVLVRLIADAIHPLRPRRILEIGCGDGSTLSAVRQRWPSVETVGVEPSRGAGETARARGHRIIGGMAESLQRDDVGAPFDLIFSIQVIEHTADPVAFLASQRSCLAPGGLVVTICPNGAIPHAELIHPDHVFSFTSDHLAAVAGRAGLTHREGLAFVLDEVSEYNQLMVASRTSASEATGLELVPILKQTPIARLGKARNAYLHHWSRLEANLDARCGSTATVVSFGTGGWSANLAGYAPAIWERVVSCAVDKPASTRHLSKPVVEYSSLHAMKPDIVLPAVNPGRQDVLCQRFHRDGFHVVQWNDLIER